MASCGTGSESTVRAALTDFLRKHNLHDNVCDIDEIVLSYVISILEELGDSQNGEENIDVDQFIEMMDAYLPGFVSIHSLTVCEWMFELASTLSNPQGCPDQEAVITQQSPATLKWEPIQQACKPPTQKAVDSAGESERSSSESSTDEIDEQIQTLMEMFPDTLRIEIEHCLHGSEGDIERTVQLILHRQDAALSITEEKRPKQRRSKGYSVLDDKADRERLVERYGCIDVAEDKRTFKPAVPKAEPKKMIRYLDNQVVNTKGQKFTEIKKEDAEEMKKTYINLKPARKYRFH